MGDQSAPYKLIATQQYLPEVPPLFLAETKWFVSIESH